MDTRFILPCHQALGLPECSNHPVGSPVSSLFHPRRPTTIRRLIIPKIVLALDCMLRGWALAHIGQEILE